MSTFPHNVPARSGAHSFSGGFALLEALVALLLFSVGILGLLGLQAHSISTTGDAEDRNRAALLADRCASQMQLQAPNVAITDSTAITKLAGACQTSEWHDYVGDPMQGGLSGGEIKITAPTAYSTVSGGSPLVPLTFGITITWTPPAHGDTPAAAPSQLSTQVTLLVQNS